MKKVITPLSIAVTVLVAFSLFVKNSAPVREPAKISVSSPDQGADSVVPFEFHVSGEDAILTFDFNTIGNIIVFSDYIEGTSAVTHEVTYPRTYTMVMKPEQNLFVRTPSGVTSFVYLFNNGTASLVVNGVLRESWDSQLGYEKHAGVDPFFSDRSYWAWSNNR